MIALLDGDIIAYRSAASCEPTKAKPDLEPLDVALMRVDELMRRILHETGAEEYKLYIGGSDNFRMGVDPNYKANRNDKPRPTWLQDVRGHLVTEWKATITDGIEADDAMAMEQVAIHDGFNGTWFDDNWSASIICSIDKDLLQVPGQHYNFVKMENCFVAEITGLRFFYQQLIQGDSSDNIMGYDGKARPKIPQFLQPKIDELNELTDEKDMYQLVLEMYSGDYERMHRNAQLLWILREEGKFWQPPASVSA